MRMPNWKKVAPNLKKINVTFHFIGFTSSQFRLRKLKTTLTGDQGCYIIKLK